MHNKRVVKKLASSKCGSGDTSGALPSIIVTGASGFIGRNFLSAVKDEFRIFAIARRSRGECGVPYDPNLQWIQTDLGNKESVNDVTDYILGQGGADFCLHLAAFYDFIGEDNPEYDRTNVEGTRNVLEMAKRLNVQRFLFASSVAACKFARPGTTINEKSPTDADHPYAHSKHKGEAVVKSYSHFFPCSIIRLAAVFSDWCEYPPLYKFLGTWLSSKYDSRILAGRGASALPYIHVQDVFMLFRTILHNSASLPRFDIYIASPDGSTSHRELFEVVTHYCFGHSPRPIFLPKFLAYLAIPFRRMLARILGHDSQCFERLWMVTYIDRALNVDASYTRRALNWRATPRYHVLRRLLFMAERMKGHSMEWRLRNEAVLKSIAQRPNLMIYERLLSAKEPLLHSIGTEILSDSAKERYERYRKMDEEDFHCYLSTIYHLLMAAVRSGDRSLMLDYVEDIALRRFAEGFLPDDIGNALSVVNEQITAKLIASPQMKNIRQEVYDYVGMTIQLAQDRVEDLYQELLEKTPPDVIPDSSLLPDCKKLQELICQLSAFYQIFPEEHARQKKITELPP